VLCRRSKSIGCIGHALEAWVLATRSRAQRPTDGFFGYGMPHQSLDASLDLSSPHRSIGIDKHPHDGPLDYAIAEAPLRRLRLRLRRPELDSTHRQVQNGSKPW
jgi:hypothetical protein